VFVTVKAVRSLADVRRDAERDGRGEDGGEATQFEAWIGLGDAPRRLETARLRTVVDALVAAHRKDCARPERASPESQRRDPGAYRHAFLVLGLPRSFLFTVASAADRGAWMEALRPATEHRSLSAEAAGTIGVAPVWEPDHLTPICRICGSTFGIVCRRHHCRAWCVMFALCLCFRAAARFR
jgi:hypothetical protein